MRKSVDDIYNIVETEGLTVLADHITSETQAVFAVDKDSVCHYIYAAADGTVIMHVNALSEVGEKWQRVFEEMLDERNIEVEWDSLLGCDTKAQQTVLLIPAGYEWECMTCGCVNAIASLEDTVVCESCGDTFSAIL